MRIGQVALCVEAQIKVCVEAWIGAHCVSKHRCTRGTCVHFRSALCAMARAHCVEAHIKVCVEAWIGAHCVSKHVHKVPVRILGAHCAQWPERIVC